MFVRFKSSVSSGRWIDRQRNDMFAKLAKQAKFKSRAAFKLLEINERFHIFNRRNKNVLDLGYAPGSWSQVAHQQCLKYHPRRDHKILGVDILPCGPLKGVSYLQGDLTTPETQEKIVKFFEPAKFPDQQRHRYTIDLIISDMMTNTMGLKDVDHLASVDLCNSVLDLASRTMKKNGAIVMKFFTGSEEQALIEKMESLFKKVYRFKPESSRDESREIYLVGIKRIVPKEAIPQDGNES